MTILNFLSQLFEKKCSLQEQVDLLKGSLKFIDSPKELVQAVHYLYKLHNIDKDQFTSALDIVGTGGDHKGLFNLSTTASFVIAGSDVPVTKSGNVGISSRSGSIDCLKALNIILPDTQDEARKQLHAIGLTFLFSQKFYPLIASIKEARLELAKQKQRTLFNFLGPLLSPLNPTHQLIGVAEPYMVQPMAEALFLLNRRGFVFCCQNTDELIPGDDMHVLHVTTQEITPALASSSLSRARERAGACPGMSPKPGVRVENLIGGTPEENATILLSILNESDSTEKRDVTVFNATFAIMLYKNIDFEEAFKMAAQSIKQGKALEKLSLLQGVTP